MSNKNTTPTAQQTATATPQLSNRTKAAIELYRRAYLVFGDLLVFLDTFKLEDDEGRFESNFLDLETAGNNFISELKDIIGLSAATDQEKELECVPFTMIDFINNIER